MNHEAAGAGPSTLQKAFRRGTHRSVPPDSTLERVRPLLPVMGITRIADVTGLDCIGVPVVMVCRPNSRSLSVSQGKGYDLISAKVSGVMESIELYHAEHITLPVKRCTYEEIRYTHHVIDVYDLPMVSGGKFHDNLRTLWIEGLDLLSRDPVWVPYELVHTDYTFPLPEGSGCFAPSSNGLASGNHIVEAIGHAAYEVIERDATTLWNMLDVERQRETRVNPASVTDPTCISVMERFEKARIPFGIWEMTSDVGLPCFLCTIADYATRHFQPLYATSGMGCHPSRDVALMRALTEAAQSRLTFIAGSRDDATRERYMHNFRPDVLDSFRSTIETQYMPRRFGDAPSFDADTLDEDVAWTLARLQECGVERIVAVNLTKAEFGIPVVRLVVSGLEGIDRVPRFTPGRRARHLLEGPHEGDGLCRPDAADRGGTKAP